VEVIDMQLHEPGPFGDWTGSDDASRRQVLTEALLEMTDAVGVDGVVLHPAEDDDWAQGLAESEPGRWASVPQVSAEDVAAADVTDRIARYAGTPGVVGVRLVPSPQFFPDEFEKYLAGGYDGAFKACQDLGLPALVMVSGRPETLGAVAERFPELQIVLDHIGIPQRPMEQPDEPQWKLLPDVVSLAQYSNVSVKVCNPIGLSEDQYPFEDVWPKVHELLGAFGAERLAWASDIGRFRGRIGWNIRIPGEFVGKHTYMESLAFFKYTDEISQGEKEQILGGTTRRILKWPTV
jgi:L-fuconolactonase